MSRPQEIEVPALGPAKRSEGEAVVADPAGSQARGRGAPRQSGQARGGANLLHSLVLVLLTASTSALGYWGYGLQQSLDESRTQLAQASSRLSDLEQLLEVTSDSAAQSGQTLSGRLEQLGKTAEEKYGHFDSEIAKLWTVAYQRNKPKLEQLEQQLAGQTEQLKAQEAVLKQQEAARKTQTGELQAGLARIEGQEARLKAVESAQSGFGKDLKTLAGVEKGQAALKSELETRVEELRRSLATLDTQVRISEEVQAEKVAAQRALLNKLGDRVAALENGAGGGDLGRRVRVNEQAIQAIDGSRRQLNQELLQIRAQLNQLQLQLQ
ncbi:hypothetical protein [Marinobacterium aestuariivivens]|uniref:ATPase n=1 Tax=Marinobacterium aestuariivivens TaxID=1698799 RepID=A0ABW1ZW72_9GAMM